MSRRRSKRNSVLSILILEVGSLLGLVSIAQPTATRDLVKRVFQATQPQTNASAIAAEPSWQESTSRFASTADAGQKPWWSYRLNEQERQPSQVQGVGSQIPGTQSHVTYSASKNVGSEPVPSTVPGTPMSGEVNLVDQAAYLSAQRLQQPSPRSFGTAPMANDALSQSNRSMSNSNVPSIAGDKGWKNSAPVAAPSYYY